MSENTQFNLDRAMKDSSLKIRNGSVFFLGPGGSGKTHTLAAFLEEEPPSVRQSTPCAKRTVRTVAQHKIGVKDLNFVRITDDQYSEMLSETAKQVQQQRPNTNQTTQHPPQPKPRELPSSNQTHSGSASPISEDITEADSTSAVEKAPKSTSRSSKESKKAPSRPCGFRLELLRRMQRLPKSTDHLHDKNMFNLRDSGGQPSFHEVLPLFIKDTSFGIVIVKLNERLDTHPVVEYFNDGERVGKPYPSPFTHKQTYRHCMKAVLSTCDSDKCPRLVFIGTHKDLIHECKDEDIHEKNRKLKEIIPPQLKSSIVYSEQSKEELLFAINAKAPGDDDRKVIAAIRKMMIEELSKIPQEKIPLQYFALENAFIRLAKYEKKGVLSKEECFKEASVFHFTRDSFEAALKYLHSLKLIFYYEDILPNVVFVDAQTLLDKITELVEFTLSLQSEEIHEPMLGSLDEFKAYGIVTLQLLSKFQSHFVPGVFKERELVKICIFLRIFAHVGKGKYLVPCLLKVAVIPSPLPCSAGLAIPALLFYFGADGAKLGVYCCLVSSLITEAKWELMTENDRPVQVSRNQVQFKLPGDDPGAITITDSLSTFFHVSIDIPEDVDADKARQICGNICPTIRETVLACIRKASQKLNYTNSIPSIAFPCSKHLVQSSNDDLHPATVSKSGLLRCTTYPASVCNKLTEQHQLWLGKADTGMYTLTITINRCSYNDPWINLVSFKQLTITLTLNL